jgi:uncharacterized protein (DUF983 family)
MPIDFRCPHCGNTTLVADEFVGKSGPCSACGETITVTDSRNPFADGPAPPSSLDDPAVRMLLPVGRSIWAIAAGYAGLFSVLMFPAPLAILLGVVAIVDIRRHPERHGMGRAVFGVVMGTLFTVPLLIMLIGILMG